MGRNIALCLDTVGQTYSGNKTNLARIFTSLVRDKDQIVLYEPGDVTDPTLEGVVTSVISGIPVAGPGLVAPFLAPAIRGVLSEGLGFGIQTNIDEAYKLLVEHYGDDDKLFLFGYSRSAHTALGLAEMLKKCGLLRHECRNLIPLVSKIYRDQGNDEAAADFKKTFSRVCKPLFIGLFDWIEMSGYFHGEKLLNISLSEDVKAGYHALSIDERRRAFRPGLWDEKKAKGDQRIEQVWFAGVHADVGGWYRESGLGDIPFEWMLRKARREGLRVYEDYVSRLNRLPAPNPDDRVHNSRAGLWRFFPSAARAIPEGSKIHESVVSRMKGCRGYDPGNLPREYVVVD